MKTPTITSKLTQADINRILRLQRVDQEQATRRESLATEIYRHKLLIENSYTQMQRGYFQQINGDKVNAEKHDLRLSMAQIDAVNDGYIRLTGRSYDGFREIWQKGIEVVKVLREESAKHLDLLKR